MEFNSQLKLLGEQELDLEGMSTVYALRTFEETNLLILGVFGAVLLVFYQGGKFSLIHKVEDICSDEVSCMKVLDYQVYVSFPSQPELIKICFPKLQSLAQKQDTSEPEPLDSSLSSALSEVKINVSDLSIPVDWMSLSTDGKSLLFRRDGLLHVCPQKEGSFDPLNNLLDSCRLR